MTNMILNMMSGGGKSAGAYCWAKFAEKPELPIGYTKLESLTTTGTEYFDSGYFVDGNACMKLKVVADFAIPTITGSNYKVSGTGGGSPMVYIGLNPSNKFAYANGTTDMATSVSGDTNRHLYTLDLAYGLFTVDELVSESFDKNNDATEERNFWIGAYHCLTGSSDTNYIHSETIYSYSFYEIDFEDEKFYLVKNLIPCLDVEGTPCLYDTVGGQTVYATGGTPTAGISLEKCVLDAYVISDNLDAYPEDGFHTDGYYYVRLADNNTPPYSDGSYVWSRSDFHGTLIGYVVSDDPSAFPADGEGDDGYYYKLQKMNKSLKYASGSATGDRSITVSGLDFMPIAAAMVYSNTNSNMQITSWAFADESGSRLAGRYVYSTSVGTPTFKPTDDGFTLTWSGYYSSLTVNWYAIGY